jgi:hypothetical protein
MEKDINFYGDNVFQVLKCNKTLLCINNVGTESQSFEGHTFSLQVSFAEQILPFLVSLVLSTGSDVCKAVMNRSICFFFRNHFETCLQLDKELRTSPLPVLRRKFLPVTIYYLKVALIL